MKGVSKLVLAVLLLGAVAVYQNPDIGGQIFSAVGFTTISVDEISFIGDTPLVPPPAWVIEFTPGGVAQWIEGTTASGTVPKEQLTSSEGEASRDFKLDVTSFKQRCEYRVNIDENKLPIYNFATQYYDLGLFSSCSEDVKQECSELGEVIGYGVVEAEGEGWLGLGDRQCGCIYQKKAVKHIGTFPTEADRIYEVKVKVSNGEESDSKVFANKNFDTTGGRLNDEVYVQSLDRGTGLSCPGSEQYLAAGSGTLWSVISKSNYENYRTVYFAKTENLEFGESFWSPETTKADLEGVKDRLSQAAQDAVVSVRWYDESKPAYGSAQRDSASDDTFYFNPDKTVVLPTIVAYVSADYVEIYQPEGSPKLYLLDNSIEIGDSGGAIEFGVENVGTGRGTAEIWADCQYPFSQAGGNTEIRGLGAGEYVESSVGIATDIGNQPTEADCTLRARILDNYDSEVVEVRYNPEKLCTPGRRSCRGNVVVQCNEFGTDRLIVEDCSDTEICQIKDGEFQCVAGDVVPNPCGFFCKLAKGIGSALAVLAVIVGIVLLLKLGIIQKLFEAVGGVFK